MGESSHTVALQDNAREVTDPHGVSHFLTTSRDGSNHSHQRVLVSQESPLLRTAQPARENDTFDLQLNTSCRSHSVHLLSLHSSTDSDFIECSHCSFSGKLFFSRKTKEYGDPHS